MNREHQGHDDDVVQRGCVGRGDEATARIERGRCQRGEPVEQHLRHEHHDQQRADGMRVGTHLHRCIRGEEVGDDRRGEDGKCSEQEKTGEREREDGRRCSVVVFGVGLHEQWHEARRENAAEEEFVDDVRSRVRGVVDVGETGAAEHRQCDCDTDEPGHPGCQRAGRDRHGTAGESPRRVDARCRGHGLLGRAAG